MIPTLVIGCLDATRLKSERIVFSATCDALLNRVPVTAVLVLELKIYLSDDI